MRRTILGDILNNISPVTVPYVFYSSLNFSLINAFFAIYTSEAETTFSSKKTFASSSDLTTTTQAPSGQCDFSEEAQRVELGEFLSRVKATYYKLHPYEVYWNPDATPSEIRQEFVAYDRP